MSDYEFNVLIIEDNLDLLYTLQDILSSESYNCFTASNISEAQKVIESYKVSLIISDINLPDKNGIQFQDELNKLTEPIPFIFITGDLDRSTFRRGMLSGAKDYITKPFSPLEIRDSVNAVIERIQYRRKLKQEVENKFKEISQINSHEIRHSASKLAGLLHLAEQDEISIDDYKSIFKDISDEMEKGINHLNNIINKEK